MPQSRPSDRSAKLLAVGFHLRRACGMALRALRRIVAGELQLPSGGQALSARPAHPAPTHGAPRALVVDRYLPRPDVDSGSVRMLAILRILRALGLEPALVADDAGPASPACDEFRIVDAGRAADGIAWMRSHRDTLRLVILSRHTVAAHWLPLVRAVLPGVPVVFDTVDLHHLREARHADRVRSPLLRMLARITRGRELRLARAADRVWVVSRHEKSVLESESMLRNVDLVSNIVDLSHDRAGFDARDGFLFLGNFAHQPNVDAVEWMMRWWPNVRRALPGAVLRVVGAGMPPFLCGRLRAVEGIEPVGHVPDVEPWLQRSRVMLAPLRYGAGVKGKLNAAFAAGLPVVATSCAVEGMGERPDECALVADTEDALVAAAVRLHGDPALWTRLADAGVSLVRREFSTAAATADIRSSLRAAGVVLEHT